MIKEGAHVYDVVFTEKGGLSIQITFALDGQGGGQQEIQQATMVFEILDVDEVDPIQLQAPEFTMDPDSKAISITNPNEAGVGKFELGFFNAAGELVKAVTIASGDTVDPSVVVAGSYTLRVRAVALNGMYITSEWSTSTATIESENDNAPITNGNEEAALNSPDTWIEWHDQGWVNANVTMTECVVDASGALKLTYSATGSNWFAVQLFKQYSTCVTGKAYKLTLNIQSSVAGKMTICGQVVELQEGSNSFTITFTQEANKATLRIQFGIESPASMIAGGTFTLSDIMVTEATQSQLEAPTFELGEDNVITITNPNQEGVGSFALGFFQEGVLKFVITVENGKAIDLSKVPAGEYTVRLKAVAESLQYVDSEWSEKTATVVSSTGTVDIEYSEEGKFSEGWRYWDSKVSDSWNDWTKGDCTKCVMDSDGKITIAFTIAGSGAKWAVQMFYKHSVAANAYSSSMTITAEDDCEIIVCGQTVQLTAGEAKTVNVESFKSGDGSAIVIQFGLTSTTITIENVVVTPLA